MTIMSAEHDVLGEVDLTEEQIDEMIARGRPVEVAPPPDVDAR